MKMGGGLTKITCPRAQGQGQGQGQAHRSAPYTYCCSSLDLEALLPDRGR